MSRPVMDAISLQERLQLIQQQQRERFKTRKSLKVKEDNVCAGNQGESTSVNHGLDSLCGLPQGRADMGTDLELKTATQEDGAGVKATKTDLSVAGANEIEYLKSCVEQLQSDKARLKSELKQKERKIVELEKEREEEKVAMGTAGTTATQRIVELSKRNRELSAEVAAEKNHVRQLQKKLKENEMSAMQQEGLRDSARISGNKDLHKRKGDAVPKPQEDEATLIAKLQEQLQQSKLKMAEQRNQCQVLKQELKLAQRVITKEVGEGANVSALLSGASGWRGRAQQIITLQSKLAELGERQGRKNGSTHVRRVASSEYYDHIVPVSMVDARQKATLRKIENDKQKNLDEARCEVESLKADYFKVQQQCSALKARNKTLTSNVKSLKEEIISLTDKEAQSGKTATIRSKSSNSDDFDVLEDTERQKQLLSEDNQILRVQLEKCLTELQTLKNDTTLSRLQPVVTRGRQSIGHHMERKAVSAGQPLGSIHNSMHSAGEDSLLAQVSQIEQERLLELSKCLQQRLDTMTDKFNRLDIEMRTIRQQNARLEKIVSRNRTTMNITNGSKGTSDPGKLEELETQLAIQMDVNAVLKETLDVTRQEKLEDMKLYQAMLHKAKMLFMNSPLGN